MSTEAKVAKKPNHEDAQDNLRLLRTAISTLYVLVDRIGNGEASETASDAPDAPTVPVGQFLQELPKSLDEMTVSVQDVRQRIEKLIF